VGRHLTRKWAVVSSNPIKGWRCFLD